MIRLYADIFLFLFALGGVSFLFVPLMLLSVFWFDRHYESVFAGMLIDIVYGGPFLIHADTIYVFGIITTAVFLLSEVLKKRLRYYS